MQSLSCLATDAFLRLSATNIYEIKMTNTLALSTICLPLDPPHMPDSHTDSANDTTQSRRHSSTSQSSDIGQIPGPTRTAIYPRVVEILLREEAPGRLWVDEGQIGVQDASPPALDLIHPSVREVSVPLLPDKLLRPGQGGAGVQRNHVYAVSKSVVPN